jgi:PAS domain S-box-containing protein
MNLQQFARQVGTLQEQVAALWPPADRPGAFLPPSIVDAFAALSRALEELQMADAELRQQSEELARQQDVLEAARRRWHDLFDLATDGYLVTDLSGMLLEANQAAAQLLAYSQAELVGAPLVALVTRPARRGLLAVLRQPPEPGAKQGFETYLKPHRGPSRIADVTVICISGTDPERTELTWLIHDVTERRQSEAALHNAHDDLERRVQERTADLEASRREARMLARRLVELQETERTAIARELHDEAGQALTALILGLSTIRKHAGETETVVTRAGELQEIADGTMEGLHRLAMRLRPVSLDHAGLAPALTQYVETFRQQNPLDVDLLLLGFDEERLSDEIEITVYRVVHEALTNVVRHAQARSVGMILERQSNRIRAIIEDDGVGFDVEAARAAGRLGLLGMRERVEMLGGDFEIESEPGKGTTVFATVPCQPRPAG